MKIVPYIIIHPTVIQADTNDSNFNSSLNLSSINADETMLKYLNFLSFKHQSITHINNTLIGHGREYNVIRTNSPGAITITATDVTSINDETASVLQTELNSSKHIIYRNVLDSSYTSEMIRMPFIDYNSKQNEISNTYIMTNFDSLSNCGTCNLQIKIEPAENYTGLIKNIPIIFDNRYEYDGIKINKHESDPYLAVEYIMDAEGKTPAHMNFYAKEFDYGDWSSSWFITGNDIYFLNNNGEEEQIEYEPGKSTNMLYTSYIVEADEDYYSLLPKIVDGTNYNGNIMSYFPSCYFYIGDDDDYFYIIVTNNTDGMKKSQYFKNIITPLYSRLIPEFYLGTYEGSGNATRIRSLSGKSVAVNITPTNFIKGAKANGDGWFIETWEERTCIVYLLTIIGKSLNGQAVFGHGNNQAASSNASPIIKTGTTNAYDGFYGVSTTKSGMKVFNVENFWGNSWIYSPGLFFNKGSVYAINDLDTYNSGGITFPSDAPTSAEKYTNSSAISAAYIKSMQMIYPYVENKVGGTSTIYPEFLPFLLPTNGGASGGSASTYWCDGWYMDISKSQVGAWAGGGPFTASGISGLWTVDPVAMTTSNKQLKCRLSYSPSRK